MGMGMTKRALVAGLDLGTSKTTVLVGRVGERGVEIDRKSVV